MSWPILAMTMCSIWRSAICHAKCSSASRSTRPQKFVTPPVGTSTPKPMTPLTPTHPRSEEHTSELQSLMRISYAVFCLKKKTNIRHIILLTMTQHLKQYQQNKNFQTDISILLEHTIIISI